MQTKIVAKSIPKNTDVIKRKSQVKEIKKQMILSKKKRKKKKITTKQQKLQQNQNEDEDEDFDNRIKNFLFCNKLKPVHRQSINLGGKVHGEIMIVPQIERIEIKSEAIVNHPLKHNKGMFLGVLFEKRGKNRKRKREGDDFEITNDVELEFSEPVQKKRKLKEVKIIKQKEQNPLKGNLDKVLSIVILRRCLNFFLYKKEAIRKKFLENLTSKSQVFDNYIGKVLVLIPESSKLKYGILFYDDAKFAEYVKNNILCKKKELKGWKRRVMTNNSQSVKKEFKHFEILRDEAKKRLMVRITNLHKDFKDLLERENLYIL
jgi:hypothetical protein